MTRQNTQDDKLTFWLALGLTLALLLVGYLAIVWLGQTPGAEPVSQEPTKVEEEKTEAEHLREQELQGPAVVVAAEISKASDIDEFSENKPIPLPTKERSIAPFTPDEHLYGNINAPFTIVQYSSLTNKYAAVVHKDFKDFIDANLNVNWVFRHYPIHTEPLDYPAAQVAECLYIYEGDIGFWKYVDSLFSTPNLNAETVVSLAAKLSSQPEKVKACAATEESKQNVVLDKLNAQLYGKVLTIPSYFFVNNKTGELRFVEGANNIAYMKAVLEAMQ